ncbi:MAG: class I tRNA ligase family protein, partial [Anaerolineae bacterium]
LRDWGISRQRYWGTPIPVVHCRQCGIVPVPEDELPVTLPEGVDFRPTGESPLRFADEWRRVRCPKCGGAADRDTDTMDTFVDSSWYQYRYLSPHYDKGPFDPQERLWLPVAQYTGGIEHATMHLLYTRFWTRVMRDMDMVDFDEPMEALFTQGIILGADSEKMSKSRGNVVDPDDLVAAHGADAVRAYLMFIGPWEAGGPWDPRGIQGVVRWLKDVWELATADLVVAAEVAAGGRATTPDEPAGNGGAEAAEVRRAAHATLAQVTSDLDEFAFNTALAALMSLRKVLKEHRNVAGTEAWDEAMRLMLLMMAPLVPHIAEELWQRRGLPYSIHQQPWPEAESALLARDTVEIAVQVRGKVRDRVTVAAEAPQRVVLEAALASDAVKRSLGGCEPSRVIYVPGRLLNLVP